MIEAVFLDAGGVFFLPDAAEVHSVLAGAGPERQVDVAGCHYRAMQALDAHPDEDVYWPAFAAAAGVDGRSTMALVPRLRRIQWTTVIAESVTGLRALANRRLRLAVVSNTEGGVEAELRRRRIAQVGEGAGTRLAAVIMSSAVGVEKPDPRIFELALEAAGASPGRTVHVGDSVHHDVDGARAAGIRPLHFDPLRLCPQPDHDHVVSLEEVAGWPPHPRRGPAAPRRRSG